jgi:hypothetical protein
VKRHGAASPLQRSDTGGIVGVMPTRRSADTTPDLFSAPPTAKAPEPLAVPQSKAKAGSLASPPRHFLPQDLAGALKRLNNAEIDALLAAVTTEAKRRCRLPPSRAKEKQTADASSQPYQAPAGHGAGSLTTGKLNAVRAAFKAGVKPSAIARQFGISQSDVRKALATEGRDRKSGC